MTNTIKDLQRLAGIQLTESWDADDDMYDDPDVKIAMQDKGQRAYERRNKKDIAAGHQRAEKISSDTRAKMAAQKDAPAASNATKEAPPKQDAKKEEPATSAQAEAKRRGRAPNDSSKAGLMRKWLQDNPAASRSAFIKSAAEVQMSPHQANTYFYTLKKQIKPVTEGWLIMHPVFESVYLAEGTNSTYVWSDVTCDHLPVVFESEDEAKEVVHNMKTSGKTGEAECKLDYVKFDEEEEPLEEGDADKADRLYDDIKDKLDTIDSNIELYYKEGDVVSLVKVFRALNKLA